MPRDYEGGLGWVMPHLSVSPPMAPHPLTLLRGSSPSRKGRRNFASRGKVAAKPLEVEAPCVCRKHTGQQD